jgi:hypothetical protein
MESKAGGCETRWAGLKIDHTSSRTAGIRQLHLKLKADSF